MCVCGICGCASVESMEGGSSFTVWGDRIELKLSELMRTISPALPPMGSFWAIEWWGAAEGEGGKRKVGIPLCSFLVNLSVTHSGRHTDCFSPSPSAVEWVLSLFFPFDCVDTYFILHFWVVLRALVLRSDHRCWAIFVFTRYFGYIRNSVFCNEIHACPHILKPHCCFDLIWFVQFLFHLFLCLCVCLSLSLWVYDVCLRVTVCQLHAPGWVPVRLRL